MKYHSGIYRRFEPDFIFFITTTVIDWVDVFTRREYRQIIADSLQYCREKKGLNIHGWVLMTNHLHLIVSHDGGKDRITQIMADFKKFTSKRILTLLLDSDRESRRNWLLHHFDETNIMRNPDASCALSHNTDTDPGPNYHLWQRGFDMFCITTGAIYQQKLDYIHANPVRAGFVHEPWEYLYSSARNYSGSPALFPIDEVLLV